MPQIVITLTSIDPPKPLISQNLHWNNGVVTVADLTQGQDKCRTLLWVCVSLIHLAVEHFCINTRKENLKSVKTEMRLHGFSLHVSYSNVRELFNFAMVES